MQGIEYEAFLKNRALSLLVHLPTPHRSVHSSAYAQSLLFIATPWTVALQTSLSMGLSRQEFWCGLSCHPPGESS